MRVIHSIQFIQQKIYSIQFLFLPQKIYSIQLSRNIFACTGEIFDTIRNAKLFRHIHVNPRV